MSEITIKAETKAARFSRENVELQYLKARSFTHKIVEPLETEDFVIQAMENTSPAKWHLAHTSWFFETFVLEEYQSDFDSLHHQYVYFFN